LPCPVCGIISVVSIIFFGVWLTKLSLDLVVSMSIQSNGSYETLGKVAFGQKLVGLLFSWASKFLYSFGCLVAYIVVCRLLSHCYSAATLVILPLCCAPSRHHVVIDKTFPPSVSSQWYSL
jgi:hypothetical protein